MNVNECPKSTEAVASKNEYDQHNNKKNLECEEIFQCSACNKTLSSEYNMRRHMLRFCPRKKDLSYFDNYELAMQGHINRL